MSRWHVMTGYGEMCMATIADEARQWQKIAPSLVGLKSEVERQLGEASLAINLVGNAARDGYLGDIERIADELDEYERRAIVLAHVGKMSLDRSRRMQQGTGFDTNKRARVEVVAEGVTKTVGLESQSHGVSYWRKPQEVAVGDSMSGRIIEFASRPELGGLIVLDRFATTRLHGLVDPHTGNPRVHVDILARSS